MDGDTIPTPLEDAENAEIARQLSLFRPLGKRVNLFILFPVSIESVNIFGFFGFWGVFFSLSHLFHGESGGLTSGESA
jgi:hypothetical protein